MKLLIFSLFLSTFAFAEQESIKFVGGIGSTTCAKGSGFEKECQFASRKHALTAENVEIQLTPCYEDSFDGWMCGDYVLYTSPEPTIHLYVKYSVIKYTDKSYCISVWSSIADSDYDKYSPSINNEVCVDQISDLNVAIKSAPTQYQNDHLSVEMDAYLGNSQSGIERLFRRYGKDGFSE